MKKWKERPRNERWMIAVIVLLLIAVAIRRTEIREGISRGFHWFDKTESVE